MLYISITYMIRSILLCLSIALSINNAFSQAAGNKNSFISTGVPFLRITPDAKTSAMAESGVAVSAEGNDFAINPSKMAFVKSNGGLSLSYIPWLRSISKEMNIGYLSGYFRLNESYVLGGSLKYFSLGNIDLRDSDQQNLGFFKPNEYALDISIAKSLGSGFSLGSSLRYIQSNIMTDPTYSGVITRSGKTIAMDVSALFRNETYFAGYPALIGFGLNLSNLGPKISYSDQTQDRLLLPANLRLGVSSALELDEDSQFLFALDFNKLLVPLPSRDNLYAVQGEYSAVSGIFSSFSDAPGGLAEELKEIGAGVGAEYNFKNIVAFRGGYNYQHQQKGSSYVSMGAGIKFSAFNVDLSYLFADKNLNAQSNTIRITMGYKFERAQFR